MFDIKYANSLDKVAVNVVPLGKPPGSTIKLLVLSVSQPSRYVIAVHMLSRVLFKMYLL